MARNGRFITVEGPEGGGKTTQIGRLVTRLRDRGLEVLVLREPGGTRTGEAIRGILQHDATGEPIAPEAEALLFAASRAQLVHTRILPALEEGTWILCDRFADSTTAYQGYGRAFGRETMERLNAFATRETVPDITFLLDVGPGVGGGRLAGRHRASGGGPDRIEREETAFHERVRAGYLDLAARYPERFEVIDGNRAEEVVARQIWSRIERILP